MEKFYTTKFGTGYGKQAFSKSFLSRLSPRGPEVFASSFILLDFLLNLKLALRYGS